MKNCSPARLRTVRGAAPSGLTEKCIKGAMYEKFTRLFPFFRLFNDMYFRTAFLPCLTIVKVILIFLIFHDFWFRYSSLFSTSIVRSSVRSSKKGTPKGIWREVSLHEWSWILCIRFGIKQRQHRAPEKIAFSQEEEETGRQPGGRVETWPTSISRWNNIWKTRFENVLFFEMILKLNWFVQLFDFAAVIIK